MLRPCAHILVSGTDHDNCSEALLVYLNLVRFFFSSSDKSSSADNRTLKKWPFSTKWGLGKEKGIVTLMGIQGYCFLSFLKCKCVAVKCFWFQMSILHKNEEDWYIKQKNNFPFLESHHVKTFRNVAFCPDSEQQQQRRRNPGLFYTTENLFPNQLECWCSFVLLSSSHTAPQTRLHFSGR